MNTSIIVHKVLPQSTSLVWKAITDHKEMVQWYFEQLADFKAEVGFKTGFKVEVEDRIYPHRWEVLEVVPEEKIVTEWRFDGYDGVGKVTFEIQIQENGTLFTVTNEGLETFDQSRPEFTEDSCRSGWEYFSDRLKEYLDGTKNS